MEIGGVAKTSSAAGSQLAARQELSARAGAVRTDLASTQSVQQPAATNEKPVSIELREDARSAALRMAALQFFIERSNDYDLKSRELVTRSINSRTGEIIRQFPDDITLKIRAFVRDINERKLTSASHSSEGNNSDVAHVKRLV